MEEIRRRGAWPYARSGSDRACLVANHEAGYLDCPADRTVWARQATRIALNGIPLVIGAGVAMPADAPRADVMRGEEAQVFGAIARDPALAKGRHTLLLPGTHSKWVVVEDCAITSFTTFFTGEMFALLGKSTLLAPGVEGEDGDAGFVAGLDRARAACSARCSRRARHSCAGADRARGPPGSCRDC